MRRSLLGGVVVLTGTLAAVGTLPADAGPALTGPPGISPDTKFTLVGGLRSSDRKLGDIDRLARRRGVEHGRRTGNG